MPKKDFHFINNGKFHDPTVTTIVKNNIMSANKDTEHGQRIQPCLASACPVVNMNNTELIISTYPSAFSYPTIHLMPKFDCGSIQRMPYRMLLVFSFTFSLRGDRRRNAIDIMLDLRFLFLLIEEAWW